MFFPDPENKRIRTCLWILAAVIFPAMFLYGYVTVTVNCHNAMNPVPMTVFAAETDSGETVLIFLDKELFRI